MKLLCQDIVSQRFGIMISEISLRLLCDLHGMAAGGILLRQIQHPQHFFEYPLLLPYCA
ncbi:hypothetical protein D3C85_1910650 [compost metagenome]